MVKISGRTHVFSETFDRLAQSFGPRSVGNKHVSAIVCKGVKTVDQWRRGLRPCPKWAFELVSLTLQDRARTLEEMTGRYYRNRKAFICAGSRVSMSVGAHFGNVSANDSCVLVDLHRIEEI